jgi:hypothetical protein
MRTLCAGLTKTTEFLLLPTHTPPLTSTIQCRAGVSEETRKVLLGHKNGDITTHYSAAELAELITAVNKIDRSLETPAITLLRVAA